MNTSNNTHDSDSEDSISRYGGYKHSSPRYEDFEMWNSPCEDAEPGWTYKEAQRQAKKQQKEAKREGTATKELEKEAKREEVARKQLEKKEKEEKDKIEAVEVRRKQEAAEAAQRQARPDAPAITGLDSPFTYQRSNHAARLRTQALATILHNNIEEKDAAFGAEHDRLEFRHDVQSRQELALELEQLRIVLVELLDDLRSEGVSEQPPPASGYGGCVSM